MIPTRRLIPLLLLLGGLVLGCTGSSKTPARVSGKITYKGQVVPAGSIAFCPPEGGNYNYNIKDGMYSGTDLPAVEMTVIIETESANPKVKNVDYGGKAKEGNPNDYRAKMEKMGKVPQGPSNTGGYLQIPTKYADKTTSGLKRTLTKGENHFDFDLTDD
jgi:hypothetical protein